MSPDAVSVEVPVWVVPGTIAFPGKTDSHVIMIGPGTGCAPFRTYIEERVKEGEKGMPIRAKQARSLHAFCLGNMLFFGCRSARADFFFSSEWLPLQDRGFLSLFTAFSRDQEFKVYVQHSIEKEGALVWQWIMERQAHVFIAG